MNYSLFNFISKKENVCMFFFLTLLAIHLPFWSVFSQSHQNKNIDLNNISIELNVSPLSPQLSGIVTHQIKFITTNVSKLQLALHVNYNVQIEECSISTLLKNDYTFTRNPTTLDIEFAPTATEKLNTTSTYSITIKYSGEMPNESSYSIHGSNKSEKYVATLSQPFGEKDWWPVFNTDLFNKYESMTMILNFPEQYKGASNGLLKSEVVGNGIKKQVWEHNHPIESYLIAFAVGEYSEYNFKINMLSGKQLNINNYVFPSKLEKVKLALNPLQDYMRVLETRIGEYPFHNEKYGHVSFGFNGGMEHQTIAFMGGKSWPSYLIIHELVHQWFGNLVTTNSWEEIWLNEGLTTYFEYVVIDDLNENTLDIKNKLKLFKDVSKFYSQRTLIVKKTTEIGEIFHRSIYYKGAFIVHKLRTLVGDDIFFKVLKSYLNNNKNGYVTIEILKDEFKKLTDLNIDMFFEHWVFGSGVPTLNINIKALSETNKYELTIAQVGGTRSYYYMKVPVNMTLEDGTIQNNMYILDAASKKFVFSTPKPLENLIVDPNNEVLINETKYTTQGVILNINKNNTKKEDILLYPNPLLDNIDALTIKFHTYANLNQEVKVTIINNFGIKISTQQFQLYEDYTIKYPISGLPKGVFIVLIEIGNEIFAEKLIKN